MILRLLPGVLGLALMVGAVPGRLHAQDGTAPANGRTGGTAADNPAAQGEFAARRLLERGQELLDSGEGERGVKIMETVIEQFPNTLSRHKANLALGKHYLKAREQTKAILYLRNLRTLETPDQPLEGEARELWLESVYLTGQAYFQLRQYAQAFPVLRRITTEYPNTLWANQAHYYIGMCHFAQGNWNKAIEALSMVGTFVDPESPSTDFVEAGRRFYVKLDDADLPIQFRNGQNVTVAVSAQSGDKETMTCLPLPGAGNTFIGSIPTELGVPKPGDGVLQVLGGDKLDLQYVDKSSRDGSKDVPRQKNVTVVSSGSLSWTLGDYQTRASAAFLGQPAFLLLHDADLDISPQADKATVRIISRYKQTEEELENQAGARADLRSLARREEELYKTRDQVTVTLNEQGSAPVHSGRFTAQVNLQAVGPEAPADPNDERLSVAVGDEIIATYDDQRHVQGNSPRPVTATLKVVSEFDGRPRATQYIVPDPVVAAKKNLVEATAFLELGRIFKSMGLMKGAKEKADEGLARVEPIIRSRNPLPSALVEQAFQLKWDLHLVKEDFASAIATCQLFNRLYPQSPFVDQALMGIATIHFENKKYAEAINVYRQILALPNSQSKPQAQFGIARATELTGKTGSDAAVAQYRLVAERYPDSPYAGESLAKLVDYYIRQNDLAQANGLLEQIFQDHPDAQFLDGMLLKWTIVAFRQGDYQKAFDKCSQLLFEFPNSSFAGDARRILPRIEERIRK